MTAIIFTFPIERCRKPSTEIANAERSTYNAATEEWLARPNTDAPVLAMMGLALEGIDNATREAARTWMLEKCAVTIGS